MRLEQLWDVRRLEGGVAESLQEDAAEEARPLRVLPIDNTQAHALTCSKARKGSLGHHFRNFAAGDALAPPLDEAIAALRRFEWVGLTDLFEPSLCLLHYQANGTLPPTCDCRAPEREVAGARLGAWTETRSTRRDPDSLDADVLARIDARTAVDGALFAAALRLLLRGCGGWKRRRARCCCGASTGRICTGARGTSTACGRAGPRRWSPTRGCSG